MPPSNLELLKNMFTEGYTYTPGGLFPATAQFVCSTLPVCDLSLGKSKDVVIHGEVTIPQPNKRASALHIVCVGVTGDVFSYFRPNNTLIGAVKIVFVHESNAGENTTPIDESKLTFTEIGTVRVDSSMVQVATSGFQKLCEDADQSLENSGGDPAEFLEKLQSSEIPGFTSAKSDDTGYSSVTTVNDESSVDISAGYGDGQYPLVLGVDEKGDTQVVYIDFLLFQRVDIIERIIKG